MNTTICNAIQARAVIQFHYDGGLRVVEPHCHGISRRGKEVLRAYQVQGHSRSGKTVDWKLFEVSKISGLQETGQVFPQNRPGYNPDDRGMRTVHCHV